ncbi:MAG: o-succinylbenzoate synthase [Luteitalea sp.]|nr:o-succinylbenzoate synthase [Luteitalea sp.]
MFAVDELARRTGPIRLARLEASRVEIAMHEPFRISSGTVASKEAVIVCIRDGESLGWGESSAMPGGFYSSETPDGCWHELTATLLPALAGRTFTDLAALDGFLRERATTPFVRVAVETAAWELAARARGQSLRALFGLPDRAVPSGLAVGLYDDLSGLRAALERYRPRDYLRLKIKITRGDDIALAQAVQDWWPGMPLSVDANGDYARDDFPVFEALDRSGLVMFEQPFGKRDLETSAALQRIVRTPICLDESVDSVEAAARAIALRSCRIVNVKLQRVGGFLDALRIMEACAESGVPVWMGTMPELGVGAAQALVLASHPACRFPTDVEPSARWYVDDLLAPALQLERGYLHVPSGPGLGFTVDERSLERHTLDRRIFVE